LKDGHRVKVVLAEKDDVKPGLFELSKLKGEGALGEDVDVLTAGDKRENLKIKLSVFYLTLMESLLSCIVGSISSSKGDFNRALFFFSLLSF